MPLMAHWRAANGPQRGLILPRGRRNAARLEHRGNEQSIWGIDFGIPRTIPTVHAEECHPAEKNRNELQVL